MGKTLRYGEFKFPSDFGFKDSSAPEGRKLVQFYAGGGRVKKAAKGGLSAAKGMDGIGYTPPPAPAPMSPMPAAAKPPRAAAPSGGRKPKGMPDLMARARIPGGMKDGGKADLAQDKALVKRAVHKHEAAMHPGKPMTKLARGGVPSHRGKPMYGGGKC